MNRSSTSESLQGRMRSSLGLQLAVMLVGMGFCIAAVESVQVLLRPIVRFENRVSRAFITNSDAVGSTLTHAQFLMIDRMRKDALRNQRLIPYGRDPLFWIKQPGFVDTDEFEHGTRDTSGRPRWKPYSTTVDETGYLNLNRGAYANSDRIEMFFAGSSAIQGRGMPSVVESLKQLDHAPIWTLALASYSPRQKVGALLEFALPKHPRTLLLDFTAGDSNHAVENEACTARHADYTTLFDLKEMRRVLRETEPYRSMLEEPSQSIGGWLSEHSIFYNLIQTGPASRRAAALAGTAIAPDLPWMVPPGYTRIDVARNARLEWFRRGMELSLAEYRRLLAAVDRGAVQVVIVYNPVSYEVYRNVLPASLVDDISDQISNAGRTTLREFCAKNKVTFWDLTEPFRAIAATRRDLFGKSDGGHWTPAGTEAAYRILREKFVEGGLLPASQQAALRAGDFHK